MGEEDEVDLEEEEDEEEEDEEEEEEEDFQGGEGLSFDVHEADEFQTPQQEEMEWVQIRDGMEDEMVGRLRRRTRNDGNNMDASISHNGEEDLDTSDFYFGLNEKKLWEKLEKANNFDSFCANVERRIHLMLLVNNDGVDFSSNID